MTKKMRWLLLAPLAVLALFGVVSCVGWVVMSLWNWLMPALFGWKLITFWQAVGLLILSHILLGGAHRRAGRPRYWRHRMMERWEGMTPEERERFREGLRGHAARCGPPETPATP